jgi:hypothetical protein
MTPAPPIIDVIMAGRLSGQRTRIGPVEELVTLEPLGVPRVWLLQLLGLNPLPVFAAATSPGLLIRVGSWPPT